MTKELFASFAIVALFVAVWALSQEWIRSWPRATRLLGAGTYMGLAAIVAMVMAVPFASGVIFDLRSVVLGLAGLFAGPIAALLAAVIAAAYRVWLGGAGLSAGMLSISIGCLSGIVAFYIRSRLSSWKWSLGAFATIQALLPLLALFVLPQEIRVEAFYQAFLPLVVLNLAASLLSAISIEVSRRRGRLIHLLKSAIKQAPDYFYIKDRQSRIVLANAGVASAVGARAIEDLVGKTDFDFTTPERAQKLFAQEQDIMRSSSAAEEEETLVFAETDVRTFVTTKTPIRNADGSVAGLVGVTKDLTERLTLEHQLSEKQNELDVVLTGMSDGLARFDAENALVFMNSNYRNLFPLTGSVRQPGASLELILDEVIRTGEQLIDAEAVDDWKREVLRRTLVGGEEQVQMADGRWLRIRTEPLHVGGAVVIVSDVSIFKRSEKQLQEVADQFKVLATTDPLTGLHNRRDFDQALDLELRQTGTPKNAVALLMIDIDHFKLYNDTYGHPAGDACLRQVAACIADACRRSGDIAARYGGEEFGVILPGAGGDGALRVASKILSAIKNLKIPHVAAPNGFVSVSIGVASVNASATSDASMLLQLADAALYKAKEDGRSRIVLAE